MDSVLESGTDLPVRVLNKSWSGSSSDSGVDVRLQSMDVGAEDNTVNSPATEMPRVSATWTSFEGCEVHDTYIQDEDSPDIPENVASEAVRRCSSKLVGVIAHQLTVDEFATDMFSSCLIENSIKCKAQQALGVSQTQQASIVVNAIMDKIRVSEPYDEPFQLFVQLLDKYSCCWGIVREIKSNYEQLKQRKSHSTCKVSDVKCELRKFRKKFAKVMRKNEQDTLCVTVENLQMKIEELQKGMEESRQKSNEEKGVPKGQWQIGLSLPVILLVSFIILSFSK